MVLKCLRGKQTFSVRLDVISSETILLSVIDVT